ncbi:MAG: hypothetical protein HRT45_08365 [Bdellovibrionales bacterium]|nr:hypothetical protein [Bdellovibrionales bacterium]
MMVQLRAMVLMVLGLVFVVACGEFKPLRPVEAEDGPGGGGELTLDEEFVSQLQEKVLGDEASLLETLGLEIGGEAEQFTFLEGLQNFDETRYNVDGLTVTKVEPSSETATSSAASPNFRVELLLKVLGQRVFYRSVVFEQSVDLSTSGGESLSIGALRLVEDECFPNGCNEVAGVSISQSGLAALSNDELAAQISEEERQNIADRFRPVSAYLSCGNESNCENAVILVQFVSSDVNHGVMPDPANFKDSLKIDMKAAFLATGSNGVMSIAKSSVGDVIDYATALERAREGITAQPPQEIPVADQQRLAALEACVEGKKEAATEEVTEAMEVQFRLECQSTGEQSTFDELLAEAARIASADVDPERLEACIGETKSRAQRELTEADVATIVDNCKSQIVAEDERAAAAAAEVEANVPPVVENDGGAGAVDLGDALPPELAAARQELIDSCINSRVSGANTADAGRIATQCRSEIDQAVSTRADSYMSRLTELAGPCVNAAVDQSGPRSSTGTPEAFDQAVEQCRVEAVRAYREIERDARAAEIAIRCADEESEAVYGTKPAAYFTGVCFERGQEEVERFEQAFADVQ